MMQDEVVAQDSGTHKHIHKHMMNTQTEVNSAHMPFRGMVIKRFVIASHQILNGWCTCNGT